MSESPPSEDTIIRDLALGAVTWALVGVITCMAAWPLGLLALKYFSFMWWLIAPLG